MHPRYSHILLTIFFTFFAAASEAADLRISDRHGIILEGVIVSGDFDKLRKLIEDNCPSKSWNIRCPDQLYLASPGGSVSEAMKIGRLVRTLRFGIEVPEDAPSDLRQILIRAVQLKDPKENYLCTSACFFIAVAGIERTIGADPLIALLGIHRPFLTDADLKTLSANQALASAAQVRDVVETYLREMGVPLKYAALMFSVPKDQVRWITQAEYEADFSGNMVELRDWLDARCDKRTDVEKRLARLLDTKRYADLSTDEKEMKVALARKLVEQVHCENALKDKMREDAWNAYSGR